MILFGVFVKSGFTPLGAKALLCMVFILITSPTAAHALARGAYKAGVRLWQKSVCDFYEPVNILRARDVMSREVTFINPDEKLEKAIEILTEKKISGLPVVNSESTLVGIITEKDIISYSAKRKIEKAKVREAMTAKVTSFPPEAEVEKIADTISKNKFRRVPIVENGKVVGIVSRRDIIQILTKKKDPTPTVKDEDDLFNSLNRKKRKVGGG